MSYHVISTWRLYQKTNINSHGLSFFLAVTISADTARRCNAAEVDLHAGGHVQPS